MLLAELRQQGPHVAGGRHLPNGGQQECPSSGHIPRWLSLTSPERGDAERCSLPTRYSPTHRRPSCQGRSRCPNYVLTCHVVEKKVLKAPSPTRS